MNNNNIFKLYTTVQQLKSNILLTRNGTVSRENSPTFYLVPSRKMLGALYTSISQPPGPGIN
jgi:hypothetical protein